MMEKIFTYKAVSTDGEIATGTLIARNQQKLEQQLWRQQLVLVKASLQKTQSFSHHFGQLWIRRIPSKQIIEFTRQLSILLKAGVPIISALQIVVKQTTHQALSDVLQQVTDNVRQGHSLASSLKAFPQCFKEQYCQTVETGELSGKLVDVFQKLSAYLVQRQKVKSKVSQAMIYPAAILLTSFLVFAVLIFKVIPNFQQLYSNFDQNLPYATMFVINASEWFRQYAIELVAVLLIFILVYKGALRFALFEFYRDKLLLKMPLAGRFLQIKLLAHINQSAALLLSVGLPLHDVLQRVALSVGNQYYSAVIIAVKHQVMTGESLNQSLTSSHAFPELMSQLVQVGEESGELESCMQQLSDIYHEQLETRIDTLISVIEPSIMVILGVIIGALIFVMYLPLFELATLV
ncbi:MAG: type II secretion system F family protein [Gammaproteobacteria bacterium]|nr:type II secretion system F family protein [Gammaproteobacteria bacterium]